MPTIDENTAKWADPANWPEHGHGWSHAWGSTWDEWAGTIFRRIGSLLPTESVLEIAPGYGRWTAFLLGYTSRYVGIDISAPCVDFCNRTFRRLPSGPRFRVGDGKTFAGVPDASISFVFSFDSLVHAEMDVIESYAREIGRVLQPGGHAFVHHSNMGEFGKGAAQPDNPHWRATSVSAETAQRAFRAAGLRSIAHEKVQWVSGDVYCDCFSLVTKPLPGEPAERGSKVFENPAFAQELALSRMTAERYRGGEG